MKTKIKISVAVLAALLSVLLTLGFGAGGMGTAQRSKNETKISTLSENVEDVVIVKDNETKFKLYYSSADSVQSDQTLAGDVANAMSDLFDIRLRYAPDIAGAEEEFEILIGETNRQASADLYSAIRSEMQNEDDLVWAYAYINGKLVYGANSALAFDYGSKEFLSLLVENNFTVKSNLSVIKRMTAEEYEAEKEAEKEAMRDEIIAALIEKNNEFTQSDFGGDPQEMPKGLYNLPHTYPTPNQHPRLFVTEENLDLLYDTLMNDQNMLAVKTNLFKYANSEDFTGIFPTKTGSSGEEYRFNSTILAQMEARALLYLLTGDEIYGYEAIIGAKNAMLSLHYTTDLHMDVYHGASQVMVNVAKVYDWCYDLLSEDDKNQIIAGVSNVLGPQMESGMRFPPSGMSAVSGHGTGPQFIRDWMTVAITFYDEMPSWWDFVGGRFYEQYVPVIDIASENGWASQGTVTYGDSKYFTRSWAAWLVLTTTGEFPYTEDFQKCAYYYFSHIQPNDRYFQTGDGSRDPEGCKVSDSCAYMFVSAALFQDPTIAAMAKYFSNDYTSFSYAFTTEMTVPDTLIFYTLGPKVEEEAYENIELIQYLEAPAGTMTARNSWSEDGIAVLMRIGEKTMANHDLYDHGTFQIYYKGLLAGTSGAYKHYGGYVHKYYLQATVAHNGLLVFDPSKADDTPNYAKNADGSDNTNVINNAARYFYSGSQRALPSPDTIDDWTDGSYDMGEILGYDRGYNADGSAQYGYIAGDITAAYPSDTVSYVGRKMLTVFTGDEKFPMVFFTYDQITSKGEDFTKYFLLHTVKEPTINEDDKSAFVTSDLGGKLVLKSLSGADTITKIGGSGYAFWINGKNCMDEYTPHDYADKIWGRIELSATGRLSDTLFSAMYVTESANSEELEFKTVANDDVELTQTMNLIVAFTKTTVDKKFKEFSFETEGTGLYRYYLSGIEAGTWKVKVDDVAVANVYSEESGGFVSFIAPSGTVTLVPGGDVIGGNGGRIKYSTGGGIFDGEYPIIYNNETATPLPTNISKPDCKFLGWYTSENFEAESAITEIPAGTTGTISIYAKWLNNIVNVDYSKVNVDVTTGKPSVNKITYNTNSSEGASFKTMEDSDGTKYLEWIFGSGTPFITTSSSSNNYASMMTEDECASFTVTLAKTPDFDVPATLFRIYTKKNASGTESSDLITRQVIFSTNENGEVRLGNSQAGPVAATLGDTPTTLRIVLDFKNEELRAYDEYGVITARTSVSVNKLSGNPAASGVTTMSEWRRLLDSIIFYWVDQSNKQNVGLKVYGIKIDEGDRFSDFEPADDMIIYNLGGGGELPDDAPRYFSKQEATKLPYPIPTGSNTFAGWYTTPTFDEGTAITEIPADTETYVTVYAKWLRSILKENFAFDMNSTSGDVSKNGVTYKANGGDGTSFITMTDESGTPYLEWHEGTASTNPFIIMTGGNIASLSDNCISYELTFSKNGSDPLPNFYLRTIAQHDVNGNKLSTSNNMALFNVTSDGIFFVNSTWEITSSDQKISDITDGKMTVRIVIDFENCLVKAYTDDGRILVRGFEIPASSGATTGEEYRKTFATYTFYMMTTTGADVADASVRLYNFNISEGNAFESSTSLDGKLNYVLGGGALPDGAPTEYLPDEATPLPTPTKKDSTFVGWYTTSTFEKGTEITEIPAGTKGLVSVYARWISVIKSEDYTNTDIEVGESTTSSIGGINYNAGSANEEKVGSTFKTLTDDSGNKYLAVTAQKRNSVIAITSSDYNLTHFKETAISYEFDLKKLADMNLSGFHGLITTTGANYGRIYLYDVNTLGEVILTGSTKVVGNVTEEFSTLRLTLDFELSTITAYDKDGKALDTVRLDVPEAKDGYTQPTSLAEWQRIATNYTFYANITNDDKLDEMVGIGFDNLKVYDGRAFGNSIAEIEPIEGIRYVTNGGTLPENTSTDFVEGAETPLAIPTRNGYVFGGWYTTETFEAASKVTSVPAGTVGEFAVFALWNKIITDEDYSSSEFDLFQTFGSKNGITYNAGNDSTDIKTGAQFKTVEDTSGNKYLEWTKGEKDPIIFVNNGAIAKSGKLQISYEITFARNGDAPLIATTARTMAQYDKDGTKLSSSAKAYLFGTNNDGTVYLGQNKEALLGTVPEDGTEFTVRVVLDFENLQVIGYLEDGNCVTESISIPQNTGVTTGEEYAKLMTTYVFCWQASSATDASASMQVKHIKISEGNAFA